MDRPALLVLRLSSLGDIVLTSSFLQAAHEVFPDHRIDYVVREDLAPLVTVLPHVERVLAVSRSGGLAGLWNLAAQLRRQRYAHVFDLHGSLRSRFLSLGMRRRRRGFGKQAVPRWFRVHARVDLYPWWGGGRPLRDRMLDPLRRLGRQPALQPTRLDLPAAALARAAHRLDGAGGGPWIGVAPGARWPSKRWPLARFAALLRALAADHPGVRFVLVGGEEERPLGPPLSQAVPGRVLDALGEGDIVHAAAILARCSLAVTHDSGLLHVAEAVGTPVVALFGPTVPEFGYAPTLAASRRLQHRPPCAPCSTNGRRPCHQPSHRCMEALGVAEVAEAVAAVLASRQATSGAGSTGASTPGA